MWVSRLIAGEEKGVFAHLNECKRKALSEGKDLIDLSVGSPNRSPADFIVERLIEESRRPDSYRYPFVSAELKESIAAWYLERFGVELDPAEEVEVLWGTQEGIAHLPLAVMDFGDACLVPDPAYPIYLFAPKLVGARIHRYPLREENGFLPDLSSIPEEVLRQARVMIVNYPNNPLAVLAPRELFEDLVELASRWRILVVHDAAYTELVFDGKRADSFLSVPGAKEVGVEFNSFSKTFNMAGMRIGFVVGNRQAVKAISQLKSNIDYGIFMPIQMAAMEALKNPKRDEFIASVRETYRRRRDVLVEGLSSYGWRVRKPEATMFVWAKVPEGFSSVEFSCFCLERAGVVVTPGNAFGEMGEGYVRMALVEEEERLLEASRRIGESLKALR